MKHREIVHLDEISRGNFQHSKPEFHTSNACFLLNLVAYCLYPRTQDSFDDSSHYGLIFRSYLPIRWVTTRKGLVVY